MVRQSACGGATLVIDTSYGSAVAVDGHEPIVESDSRTHVERLQENIDRAMGRVALKPGDLGRIVVGVGPAPFTGLRVGIVVAKALAMATGATLMGQDVLSAQAALVDAGLVTASSDGVWPPSFPEESSAGVGDGIGRLILSVNDARRRQVYAQLSEGNVRFDARHPEIGTIVMPMDIGYPDDVVRRVNDIVGMLRGQDGRERRIVVVGHGVDRYHDVWQNLHGVESVADTSVFDAGANGVSLFVRCAVTDARRRPDAPVEPLYLRRPDVSVPNPLKRVLHHGGTEAVS